MKAKKKDIVECIRDMNVKRVKNKSSVEYLKPSPLALWALDVRFRYAENQMKEKKDKRVVIDIRNIDDEIIEEKEEPFVQNKIFQKEIKKDTSKQLIDDIVNKFKSKRENSEASRKQIAEEFLISLKQEDMNKRNILRGKLNSTSPTNIKVASKTCDFDTENMTNEYGSQIKQLKNQNTTASEMSQLISRNITESFTNKNLDSVIVKHKKRASKSTESKILTEKEVFANSTLREAKRMSQHFMEQKLKQRLQERGGLYPKEYSYNNRRSEFSMANQLSYDQIKDRSKSVYGNNEGSDFTTVIRQAYLFEKVPEEKMINNPLSDETILMGDTLK